MKHDFHYRNLCEEKDIYYIDNFKIKYKTFIIPDMSCNMHNYIVYYKLFGLYIKLFDVNKFYKNNEIIDNFTYNKFTDLLSGYVRSILHNNTYVFDSYYGIYLIHSKLYYYISRLKIIFKIKYNKPCCNLEM